jgi:hypothetical protein
VAAQNPLVRRDREDQSPGKAAALPAAP